MKESKDTMSQQQLTYLKFAVVALVIVGIFLLAALGKMAADAAMSSIVTITTGLVVALGISGAASAMATRGTPALTEPPKPPPAS